METTTEKDNTSFINVEEEVVLKDEPMSPASSVSSRISEAGSSKKSRGITLSPHTLYRVPEHTKPTKSFARQQRLRSAWASAQSDPSSLIRICCALYG